MARYLSVRSARRFYNAVGSKEDSQAFYEDPALDILVREGRFGSAASVFEFGCGTGRLAERLLAGPLPENASYTACDISPRMVALAKARLARFGTRVEVFESSGDTLSPFGRARFDRVVTSYVLDLLPPGEIDAFLQAAASALTDEGLLCAASIAPGKKFPSSAVMGIWRAANSVSPILTGGCRPIDLDGLLPPGSWSILHVSTVTAWGVTSKVVIASRR